MTNLARLRISVAALALAVPLPLVAQDTQAAPGTPSESQSGAASGTSDTGAASGSATTDSATTGSASAGSATADTATGADASGAETATVDADAGTVVAVVNGTELTLGHMVLMRANLPQQYNQLPPEVLFAGLLDQLVQQTALSQSFEGTPPQRVELALDNERRGMLASEAVTAFLETPVSEDEIAAAYEEQYSDAEGETEFKAAHILVESEDEAKALIEELDGGADFATLAQENSTGPSAPSGGDLGWFGPGMMVPAFEEAVTALEPGNHTAEPVQTQFGWHVIRLDEMREKSAPTLEEVRADLQTSLQRAAVEAHIASLVDAAEVDRSGAEGIDPAVLNDVTLLD